MTVLITGFEPFGDDMINPSSEAVRMLPDLIGEARIVRCRLPVVFGEAAEILKSEIETHRPQAVICVGLAGGRRAITPEVIAVNLKDARIPDNKGQQPRWVRIDPKGEDGLLSTLPVQAMVDRMQAKGIPAELSYSAGTFVCNEVFYQLMRSAKGSGIEAGFVHVPYSVGMKEGQPAMELEAIARGLRVCVETLSVI